MIGVTNTRMMFSGTNDYRRKIADFIDANIPEAKNISRHLREICCSSNDSGSEHYLEMCRYCCTDWSKSGGYTLRVIPSHRARQNQRSRSKLNRTSLDKLLRKPTSSLNSYQRKLVDRVKSSGLTITVLTCLACKKSTKIKNQKTIGDNQLTESLEESVADNQMGCNLKNNHVEPGDNLLVVSAKKKKKKRKKDSLCGLKSSAVAQVKRFASANRNLLGDSFTASDNSSKKMSKISIGNHNRNILKLDTEQPICNFVENNSLNLTTIKNGGKTVNSDVDSNSVTNSVDLQKIDSTKNLSSINQTSNKESIKLEKNSIKVSSSPIFNLYLTSKNKKNKKNKTSFDQKQVLSTLKTSSGYNDGVDEFVNLSKSVVKESKAIKSCILKDGEKSVKMDNTIGGKLLNNQQSLSTDEIKNDQGDKLKFTNELQFDEKNVQSVEDCLKLPIKQLYNKNNLVSDNHKMVERGKANLVSDLSINSAVWNSKCTELKKLSNQTGKMAAHKNDKINDKMLMNLTEVKSKTALSLNSNRPMKSKRNKKGKNMKKFNRYGGIKEHRQSNSLNSLSVQDLLNLT